MVMTLDGRKEAEKLRRKNTEESFQDGREGPQRQRSPSNGINTVVAQSSHGWRGPPLKTKKRHPENLKFPSASTRSPLFWIEF